MQYPSLEEIRELSTSDRLQLIEDVWETLAGDSASFPVPEDHEREIDQRLEAWQRNPNDSANWEEVRRRISKS